MSSFTHGDNLRSFTCDARTLLANFQQLDIASQRLTALLNDVIARAGGRPDSGARVGHGAPALRWMPLGLLAVAALYLVLVRFGWLPAWF